MVFVFVVAQKWKLEHRCKEPHTYYGDKQKHENMDLYARYKSELYVFTTNGGHSTCILLNNYIVGATCKKIGCFSLNRS